MPTLRGSDSRAASPSRRRAQRAVACASAALLLVVPIDAQSRPLPGGRTPVASAPGMPSASPLGGARRANGGTLLRSSAFGALTGTIFAFGYYFMSERGERSSGCQPLDCALPFLSVSGAVAGLFIGRELDAQRRALAPRAGESIEFGFSEAKVLAPPSFIDVRDSLIAVVSDSGAQLLSALPQPKALRRRATGLSAMRQVAIAPGRGTLLLGTGTALWETNLVNGPATRVADGGVDALATSSDAVLSASGRTLRFRRGTGTEQQIDSLVMSHSVSAIAYDSLAGRWWVATDSQLVQVSSENGKLAATSVALALPSSARAITTDARWIAAALGDEGVIAWPRASLAAGAEPVRVTDEPRFAYDLAFLDGVLYVAGGVDGVFQLSLTPTARVLGSSRQVQFATTVRAGNGVLWVGDRNRQSVVRVTP